MSFLNSIKNYSLAESLFDVIEENFSKIDQEPEHNKSDYAIEKLFADIKKLTSILNKINIDELEDKNVSQEDKENIEYNINFMYEAVDHIYRYLQGKKLINDLIVPVSNYFKKLNFPFTEYKKWAKNNDQLTKKYIAMLTHPNNVLTYKNQIKRMALGTMSLKEFEKIYYATKDKMIPLYKPAEKFQSFKEYKDKKDDVHTSSYKKTDSKFKF